MTVEHEDFEMVQGESKRIYPTDNPQGGVRDEEAGGTKNISNFDIKFVLTKKYGRSAVLTKTNSSSGVVIDDGQNGIFHVILESSDTESLRGVYEYEIKLSNGNDMAIAAKGQIVINPTST